MTNGFRVLPDGMSSWPRGGSLHRIACCDSPTWLCLLSRPYLAYKLETALKGRRLIGNAHAEEFMRSATALRLLATRV